LTSWYEMSISVLDFFYHLLSKSWRENNRKSQSEEGGGFILTLKPVLMLSVSARRGLERVANQLLAEETRKLTFCNIDRWSARISGIPNPLFGLDQLTPLDNNSAPNGLTNLPALWTLALNLDRDSRLYGTELYSEYAWEEVAWHSENGVRS